MPVYEYVCVACETRFEKLGSIATRAERADCPQCRRPTAERMVSKIALMARSEGGAGGCCGGGGGGCACRA